MTKHTPGPWYIVENYDPNKILIARKWDTIVQPANGHGLGCGSYLGVHVAELSHQNDNPCVPKTKALSNANLIAAAPDLLGELKRALFHLERLDPDFQEEPAYKNMKEAITKAEGKPE